MKTGKKRGGLVNDVLSLSKSVLGNSRKADREISSCVEELQRVENALPAVSKEIGTRYLKSSEMLEALISGSERLVKESEELLHIAAEASEGNSVVSGTTELLAPAFGYLDGWREAVRSREAELQTCAELFVTVQTSQAALRTLVSPLTHIQTMFRIESASLPEEVRQVFTGLTAEIEKVHREVNETFGQQFASVSNTGAALRDVQQKITQKASQIEGALTQHKEQIAASLERLRTELARNAERENELSQATREVNEGVSSMVMAMQAHDIASQRLEAIINSLSRVRELLRNGQSEQEAWSLIILQKAHLEDVRKQLEESEQALRTAIEVIVSRVGSAGDCSRVKQFEDVTAASNGSIDLSLAMISDVRTLLSGAIEFSHLFESAMKPLANLTHSLTNSIEGLSIQMRLVALNAQVQAVQIGTGTGLEVLAAQTATVSGETSAIADTISSGIGRVVTIVQAVTNSFQSTLGSAEETLSALERDALVHEATLHAMRDRTLRKVQDIGSTVQKIRTCSGALANENSVRFNALTTLEQAAETLGRADLMFRHRLGEVDVKVAATLATSQYKMTDERVVHARVVDGLTAEGFPESAGTDASAETEDEPLMELF